MKSQSQQERQINELKSIKKIKDFLLYLKNFSLYLSFTFPDKSCKTNRPERPMILQPKLELGVNLKREGIPHLKAHPSLSQFTSERDGVKSKPRRRRAHPRLVGEQS